MRSFILLAAAAAAVLAAPAVRAHGDDHGPGHGHGHGHGPRHKEVFWEGDCKVERTWKHGAYEEKRTCRPPRRVVVVKPQPQVTYVYPPWMHRERNEVAYVPKYQPQQVVSGASYCQSETVGQVLGGVVGGALGSQIGKGNGRTAATIGGAIAGVLVGGDIGRRMDAGNQACVGQVLEVAPVNHRVQWVQGPSTYVVVPAKPVMRKGVYCRPYTVESRGPHGLQRSNGTACRRADGVWVAA